MLAGPRPIGELAAVCGFADRAHLTREFRELGGCTPGQWRRETLPFVQDRDAATMGSSST